MNFFFSFMMEFWLSGSLSNEPFLFFHDEILAIRKPFTRTFSFLSRWNSGYHRAFSRIFLSFHDGILAITEPSHDFFFHTMESWLSRSFLTNFSFTQWNLGYHGAFSRIFLSHDGMHKMHDLGGDSFHIYHKEYLHRIHLVKKLAS
jgi:hypothetical protein